ncbi:MAG: hypothetical protein AAF660_10085 [Pseudomonadota bacterium]
MKTLAYTVIATALLAAGTAAASDLEQSLAAVAIGAGEPAANLQATQGNCISLSQAVESVRRRRNVERIVSANTRQEGGREVHHIRYMTKDGKVRTAKVQGCRR